MVFCCNRGVQLSPQPRQRLSGFLPEVPSLWGFLTVAAGSRAVPGRDELVGTVPPWSVLSKALRSLGSPRPSILQRPAAWGPCNPHTLSDSGVSLPSAAAWKVQAVSWALAGSRGSRTAITQCVKVVAACVVKASPGGAGTPVWLGPRGLWMLGWVLGLFPHLGLTLFALAI